MPKQRNRSQNGVEAAGRAPVHSDRAVHELKALADQDVGSTRERIPRSSDEAEADALPEQRAVYERIMGKKLREPAKRTRASQRDERGRLDDEEDEELEEDEEERKEINGSDDDEPAEDGPDDDEAEDEDDEGRGTSRVSGKKLETALNALKRAKVPKRLYDKLDDEDVVQLAESYASYQSDADRVLGSKDETIRALQEALAGSGKGKQASADDESPGAATPPEEDLVRAAEGLARSLGVEGDENAKKALIEYGRATRKGSTSQAEAREVERLQATVREMILDRGVRGLRRKYPQLRSDSRAVSNLKARVIELAQGSKRYANDTDALFRDAAVLEFGQPKNDEGRDGRARARRSGAPVTQARQERRSTRAPAEGTEEHDRAVYRRVMQKQRRQFAVRR